MDRRKRNKEGIGKENGKGRKKVEGTVEGNNNKFKD
jgi:hypothetical protein